MVRVQELVEPVVPVVVELLLAQLLVVRLHLHQCKDLVVVQVMLTVVVAVVVEALLALPLQVVLVVQAVQV